MKWIKAKPGVRYRKHPTRKHGTGYDRYYTIYYKMDGKAITEAVGWASRGITVSKATGLLNELAENRRRGEAPYTLKEKRALESARREKEAKKAIQAERNNITFRAYFEGEYTSIAKGDKAPDTWTHEKRYMDKWVLPVIGSKTLREISPLDIEKIKRKMAKAKRAPRSIQYTIGIIRHVYNIAIDHEVFNGLNPIRKNRGKDTVKSPKFDNRRIGFLSREQAAALLEKIAETSPDVHDMALLSLHTGMRAGEIFNLTWRDVNLDEGTLKLRDTKNTETRTAYLTEATRDMLQGKQRPDQAPEDVVFHARGGGRIKAISNTFAKAVDSLELNKGITDRRHRIVFHSLRHSFASWHAQGGTDLYILKELLGHKNFKMTERYSHLGQNALRAATDKLDATFAEPATVTDIKEAKG